MDRKQCYLTFVLLRRRPPRARSTPKNLTLGKMTSCSHQKQRMAQNSKTIRNLSNGQTKPMTGRGTLEDGSGQPRTSRGILKRHRIPRIRKALPTPARNWLYTYLNKGYQYNHSTLNRSCRLFFPRDFYYLICPEL